MSEPQEKLLFASQLLIEKTLHYSLDSNKARTLNVPSLIEEALTQIDVVENESIPDINFRIIIDEINKNFVKNKIVTDLLDFPLDLLKVDSDQPIEQIKPKLEIAASVLSDRAYVSVIFYELENNFDELGKKDISFYVGELVTTLVNMGMSASHIHFCTKNIF